MHGPFHPLKAAPNLSNNFNCTRTFFLGYLIRWLMANEVWTAAKKEINGHPFYELRSLLIFWAFSELLHFLVDWKKARMKKEEMEILDLKRVEELALTAGFAPMQIKKIFLASKTQRCRITQHQENPWIKFWIWFWNSKLVLRLELRLSSLTRQEKRSKIWRLFFAPEFGLVFLQVQAK